MKTEFSGQWDMLVAAAVTVDSMHTGIVFLNGVSVKKCNSHPYIDRKLKGFEHREVISENEILHSSAYNSCCQ